MTDKEKLDKLVAEIERRKKMNILNENKYEEDIDLLSFYNSMQEEPKFKLGDIVRRKSDGLEARVINIVDGTYIVECEDWNDSILEHQWELVKETKECMYSKGNYTDEDRKVLCGGCEKECEFKPATSAIPLTAEILEKNGFEKTQIHGEKQDDIFQCFDGEIIIEVGIYDPNFILIHYRQETPDGINSGELSNIVKVDGGKFYLHELQHALRLCGLKKTIEL